MYVPFSRILKYGKLCLKLPLLFVMHYRPKIQANDAVPYLAGEHDDKNRAELMVERLRNMQAAAPDIEASAVVSVDGLIMASALQQGVEEDRVSAMSAAMLKPGRAHLRELGREGLEQVYIKGDKGSIVLTSVGEEAVLTALARQDAKLGLIFLEMRRAAEDIFETGWMKTITNRTPSQYAIPDGEGFTALPI